MCYRHFAFEVPWFPGTMRSVWSVEARVEFDPAENEPVTVKLTVPGTQDGYTVLSEIRSINQLIYIIKVQVMKVSIMLSLN